MLQDSELIDHSNPETVYSVAHFQFGIAIRGDVPLDILNNFIELFRRRYSYDVFDGIIADYLGASFVFTTKPKAKMWRKSLGLVDSEVV